MGILVDKAFSMMVKDLQKPGEDIIHEVSAHKAELIHMAVGISGEAGELLDAVKKHGFYDKELDILNVVEELGDLEFYLEGIRQVLKLDREEILRYNIDKLSKRYSSGKFSNEQAHARADKNES